VVPDERAVGGRGAWGAGDPEPIEGRPRISGYRIEGVLGRGATGVVYSAVQLAVDRPVAIKVLHDELVGAGRAVRRLQREARTAARLAHPGIISAIDMGEQDGRWWYAMELVEGISLAERLAERGPLTEREALRFFCPLCDALQHLYEGGVVHRDIKPANILIDQHGRARLVDLGLAFAEDDPSMTRSGGTLGTPHYMSPEQARDATSADQRSDIWSLGATLYHSLCGSPPYEGESVGEILSGVLYHRVTEPRSLAPHLSKGISLVLRKCLAREPGDRYETPEQLLADLERLRERRAPAVRPANLDPVAMDIPYWRRPGVLTIAALVVVSLVAGRPWRLFLPNSNPTPVTATVRAWPAFTRLQETWVTQQLDPGDALVELALLPDAPEGWGARKGELEREVLQELDQRLARLMQAGSQKVDAWLGDHEYEQARSYLGESVAVALRASTGCDSQEDLPAGRLRRGFERWMNGEQSRLDSEHTMAMAEARSALHRHLDETVVPAFNQALRQNQWASALTHTGGGLLLLDGALADTRGFSDIDRSQLLGSVRSDLEGLRSSARNHYLRLDSRLAGFARDEADRLRPSIISGDRPNPAQDLRAAFTAEARHMGIVPEEIPQGWIESNGRSVGSQLALERAEEELNLDLQGHLDRTAEAAFVEDSRYVQALCADRRYSEASRLLEQHLAEPWRSRVHGPMELLREECLLLEGLIERTLQNLQALAGSTFDPTFDRIPYPGTRILTTSDALKRGFEVRAPSIPSFRVHLIRSASIPRADRVLEATDLLELAGLGEQATEASADERLLRSLFLFHERELLRARVSLPMGPVDAADVFASLAERLRNSAPDPKLQAKNDSMKALRTSVNQGGNATSLLADIRRIEEGHAGLLSEEERAELLDIRRKVEARRAAPPGEQPKPTLQDVFEPSQLERLERQAVRLTWDFTRRDVGAWKHGDWLLFSGGLRAPVARGTDEEFWDDNHALQLDLAEPLDLNSPFTLRLHLFLARPAPGQRNELALQLAGLTLVFEDDPNQPSFAAGRGDPAQILEQVRQGSVAGFTGFSGFSYDTDRPLELEIEVNPRKGNVEVQLNGKPLRLRSLPRGPLPKDPILSLHSRQSLDLLWASLEAKRLGGRK